MFKRKSDPPKKKKTVSRRRLNWSLFMQDVHYNLSHSSFHRKAVAFGKLLILLFIMIGIPLIMVLTMKDSLLSTSYWAGLPKRLGNHKILSFIILTLLQAAQLVISVLPAQPVEMVSSYLYGIGGGYAVCITGAFIGTVITYYLGSFLGGDALHVVFGEKRVKDYVHKLNSAKAYLILFLIYLIPGIPKDMVSYVAGISDIKLKPFMVISLIARTPGVIGGLLLGNFLKQKNYVGIGLVVVVFAAILFVCWKKKDKMLAILASYEDKEDEETTDK